MWNQGHFLSVDVFDTTKNQGPYHGHANHFPDILVRNSMDILKNTNFLFFLLISSEDFFPLMF